MSAKVHYEDNLFFVQSILRTIEAGLRLDIDPEFFYDKILEDIFFVDATISRAFSELKDSTFVINRIAHLRSVRRTSSAYSVFLDRLQSETTGFSRAYSTYHEKFAATLDDHLQLRRQIDSLLDELDPEDEQTELVSSQEYGFLLAEQVQDSNDNPEMGE